MHSEFLDLLDEANGISEFIIALNLDIRGFSAFSMKVESSEVALFLKKAYRKLISNYFPNASFFKPTGDGLLIIVKYDEENLKEIITNIVTICYNILNEFPSLFINDPMINFDVPKQVGIGLSRGAACSLVSEGRILDFSGRVINLASRLMDLARPSGIVFDSRFGIDLLPGEISKLFSKESVYFKGIAERSPVDIYYTKDYTTIHILSKQPIEKVNWKSFVFKQTLKMIKRSSLFNISLPSEPIDKDEIKVKISHPKVIKRRRQKDIVSIIDFHDYEYFVEKGISKLRLNYELLGKKLEGVGIKDDWEIEIEIIYAEK